MKKKILIAVICIVCLLSVILAGCTIEVNDIDKDFIGVVNEAIKNSVEYKTFYIREEFNTDPANIASNETTEYLLNWQDDDKSIEGVNNTKVNFTIKKIKGITEYSNTFTFGQSLPAGVKAKDAKAADYKFYVFENYKQSESAPVFTRSCEELTIADIDNYVTPKGTGRVVVDAAGNTIEDGAVNLKDYKITDAMSPMTELTKDDIKLYNKECTKKGKVSTYVFEVTKEGHEYKQWGKMQVLIYHADKPRIMAISSLNEKYTLDVMYQGPIINTPSYDTYSESDNKIDIFSTRSDGMVELYSENGSGEYVFFALINPAKVNNTATKKGEENNGKIKTVESAVNWSYEYTEIVLSDYTDDEGNVLDGHFFIKTSNIVKTEKDFTSLIPMAAGVVAVIALLIALMALFKAKKQAKLLTAQIKAMNGEDAEAAEAEESAEATAATEGEEAEATKEEATEAEPKADAVEQNAETDVVAETAEEKE